MPRNFNLDLRAIAKSRQSMVRAGLGALLLANLAAAWFVFQTPGGSLEQLESEMMAARKQIIARQQAIERLKQLVARSAEARDEGDRFLASYFLDRQIAYSTLEVELAEAAKEAGIRARERTFNYEPIEGSSTLGMLTVNANFEGTYADLIEFVNQVDRSKRLLIIEALSAQPQQGGQTLSVTVKLNVFFRHMEPPVEVAQR
jgi:Tfp pilus assembly protein PilO